MQRELRPPQYRAAPYQPPPYQPRPQQMLHQPPRRRRRRRPPWRFRGWYLGIPLVIACFLWLSHGVEPAFEWQEVMDWMNVEDRELHTQLATLGVLICAALLVLRIWRGPRESNS